MIQALVRKNRKRTQRGVTLVELLVVLAILALITAIVVINVLPARDQAAVDKARIDVGVLETALDQYRLDMMNYPTTQQGLDALIEEPSNAGAPARGRAQRDALSPRRLSARQPADGPVGKSLSV